MPWIVVEAHNGDVRLEMDPWEVCMPVVADFKHFDEEQEPNPDPHQCER
jgi:hypothetical protein